MRVLRLHERLHERLLEATDAEAAKLRLGYVIEWYEGRQTREAERSADLRIGPVTSGQPDAVQHMDMMGGFADALSYAENLQMGGPRGIGGWRFASMLLTSLPLVILLGIALPTIHLRDRQVVLAAKFTAVSIVCWRLSEALARLFGCLPQLSIKRHSGTVL